MDSDEEDFVFYGTPIEREEELSSRKKKALAESSGHLRSLPAWKQEVRDEEGRRRFHGAFTGGFSAGYYNTAGSKEGWAPQSFTSSRKNRAEVKQQSILNFLDEDEKAELEGRSLATSSKFDTFGFTAAEIARKQAEKEQQHRQSAIPGPAPDEIVLPVTESIGEKLLKKMGWRHGHSIKDSHINTLYDARREARKAFLAFTSDEAPKEPESEPITGDLNNLLDLPTDNDVKSCKSTPVFVLNPKQDLHGLGYDPYKYAPEFRERKRLRRLGGRELGHGKATKDNLFGFKSRDIGPGFGIGALEELDAEDEDVYASGYEFGSFIEEVEEPSRPSLDMQDRPRLTGSENGILPGFKLASKSDSEFQRFDPPVIPKDFEPHHRFSGPLETKRTLYDPPPPEAPPPEDHNIKLLIEGVAALVARCGKLFEDLSKEKNRSNPLYSFLNGGNFHEYYARKLWEEKQKRDQSKLFLEGKPSQDVPKLTADSRGRILGERPLESRAMPSNSAVASADVKFQTNLTDTFTKPAVPNDVLEVSKPFKDDPAKQERYEQFLKEKYHGGLRSYDSGGANNMSEAARARERLDFEAAAAAIEKGYLGQKDSTKPSMDFSSAGVMQFTAGGIEQVKTTQDEEMKLYPKREEFQWRPSPILCKRFDLIDPYMGQPPPAPRIRSKVDTLFFLPDIAKVTKVEESATTNSDALSTLDNQQSKTVDEVASDEKVEVENVERPVDLYKAIFSDDSDDEGENSVVNKEENSDKKVQAANATLNRLIAGDFLESLGKELGLEVPADQPISSNKAGITNEKVIAHASVNALPVHDESSDGKCEVDMGKKSQGSVKSGGVSTSPGDVPPSSEDDKSRKRSRQHHDVKSSSEDEKSRKSSRQRRDVTPSSEDDKGRNSSRRRPDVPPSSEDEKTRKSSRWRNDVTPSFEDEKSRKSSRRHCYSGESNGDSPGDQHDRYYSRSKERRKESHREERRSRRKHSKHREHRSGDSPERSSRRRSEKHRAEAKREKLS